MNMFLHMFFFTYVLGAQKNHLIEMVLLSTHNISFDWEMKKNTPPPPKKTAKKTHLNTRKG